MRKFTAMVILLTYIAVYIAVIASISMQVTRWPSLAQLVFYIAAGILWIAPLKPLFAWMNKGQALEED